MLGVVEGKERRMLTRIEIDGFKTFERAALDVPPFLVILGPNASGKSNLFDAIRFLSQLASADLRTASRGLRGEPHELFRRDAHGEPGTQMRLAAEVLLEREVRDPWGQEVNLVHTRVRYEVAIERRVDFRGIERLAVTEEVARPLSRSEDPWLTRRPPEGVIPETSDHFRDSAMRYAKHRRSAFLETLIKDGKPTFQIHQDTHQGRVRPAEAAEATVLSSITTAEFPHLYALREELRSWRFLQLDPASLRRTSPILGPERLEPDGSNLAAVLARIQAETATVTRPKGALVDIAADLGALIPGVADVSVIEDARNREYRTDIVMRDGRPFSSRVVSDGTLRVLALLTMLHDPKHHGLVCFEEPENGIHPMRLRALIHRLRELVTDPSSTDTADEPLSQILMNSHSPVVLAALKEGREVPIDVGFADIVDVVDPASHGIVRKTRIRSVRSDLLLSTDGRDVPPAEVERYLSTVDAHA
jgi:predicted ATPase